MNHSHAHHFIRVTARGGGGSKHDSGMVTTIDDGGREARRERGRIWADLAG